MHITSLQFKQIANILNHLRLWYFFPDGMTLYMIASSGVAAYTQIRNCVLKKVSSKF